jgi:UDP-N-acetylmuramoyl-L-alanyl-D-glutamate--2,6-diaminopimelate ligase
MNDVARTLTDVGNVLRSADLLLELRGAGDVAVRGVTQDSRNVRPGDLFLAWKGTGVDAHAFVGSAALQGAVGAIVERPVDDAVPQLVVSNGRRAAALAADAVMGSPSREMTTIGITGTNGKTTTALLARHLLSARMSTAVVGTLGIVDAEGVRPGSEGLTTPGPVQIAVWLRDLADGGTEAVVLEASSHALEQYRLDGVSFDIAVFTNLTQDHLDYHGDMASYRRAKARLVELVAADGTVILNASDPAWDELDVGARKRTSFSIDADADLKATELRLERGGTSFTLHVDESQYAVRTPLVGRYNVENTLAAIGVARAAGMEIEEIVERLESAPHVAGRLEAIVTDPFSVLIDFAHTPAALTGALAAVKPLTEGRLIVLFGAGGDRDPTKRRPMAEAVRDLADVIVLTSDNPRTEDPEAIIDDVAEGLAGVDFLREADRRTAIRCALELARPGDTVVLAGKGHESYQVIGTEKLPFNEREIVESVLRSLGVA